MSANEASMLPPVPAEPVPPAPIQTGAVAPDGAKPPKKEKKDKGQGGKGGKSKGKGKTPWRPFNGPMGSGSGFRLNVKNLSSQTASAEALRALFAPFGHVSSAEVKTNEDGSSRGFGFVVLGSEAEGAAALAAMNGKVVGGKALKVAPAQRRDENEGLEAGKGGPAVGLGAGLPGDPQAMLQMQMMQMQQAQAAYMQALLNPLGNPALANPAGPTAGFPTGLLPTAGFPPPAGLGAGLGGNPAFMGFGGNPALNPYAALGLGGHMPPFPSDMAGLGAAPDDAQDMHLASR